MFSILKINEQDRPLIPEKLRELPAYAIYEQGKITGYCVYKLCEEAITIMALSAEDCSLADAAFRTALYNAQSYTDSYGFSAEFDSWNMLPPPVEKNKNGGKIATYLASCC